MFCIFLYFTLSGATLIEYHKSAFPVKHFFNFFIFIFRKEISFLSLYRFSSATRLILPLHFEDVNKKLYLFSFIFLQQRNTHFSLFIHYTISQKHRNCINCITIYLSSVFLYPNFNIVQLIYAILFQFPCIINHDA